MRKWVFLLLLSLGLLLSQAVLGDNTLSDTINYHPSYQFNPIPEQVTIEGHGVVEAPIGDFIQSPIIRVYINGKGPYFLLFDTGVTHGTISKRLIKELNLPYMGGRQHIQATPSQVLSIKKNYYLLKELKIGNLIIENYVVLNNADRDDSSIFRKSISEPGVDGIIGLNAFYGLMLTIDYQKNELIFDKGSLSKTDPNVLSYAIPLQGLPNIELTVNFERLKRKEKQVFVVDTGFYGYIKFNTCAFPEIGDFVRKELVISKDSLGKENPGYFAPLYGSIEVLPGYDIKSPNILFNKINCESDFLVGLIGRFFFEKNLVTIDPDDELIRIKKYEDSVH